MNSVSALRQRTEERQGRVFKVSVLPDDPEPYGIPVSEPRGAMCAARGCHEVAQAWGGNGELLSELKGRYCSRACFTKGMVSAPSKLRGPARRVGQPV